MKNSIVFKFLAIALCAASLAGIVGGAAGALTLAECDLYNRTVDQMLDDRLGANALQLAEQTALAYASQELGGCPAGMAQYRYSTAPACNYGYTILDAEGKVLASAKPELEQTAQVYSFPVTGQYMHFVSAETESELRAKEAKERMDQLGRSMADIDGELIPAEGVAVSQVMFTDATGCVIYEAYADLSTCYSIFYHPDDAASFSETAHEPRDRIGFLFYGSGGQIVYHSFLEEQEPHFRDTEICGVMFLSHTGELCFQLEDPAGLGILTSEGGSLRFTGYTPEPVSGETEPEETVPETTAETLPPETVSETRSAEETLSEEQQENSTEASSESPEDVTEETQSREETHEEQEASSASAVPEEDGTETGETQAEETLPPETQAAETLPPETLPPETLPPETLPPETLPEETAPPETEPVLINGKPLQSYQINRMEYADDRTGQLTTAKYVYLTLPEMTVEVYLDRNTLHDAQLYELLGLIRQYRSYLLPVTGICLLVFVITVIYLCTAAGRQPRTDEIRAGGLNRLPLDLYLFLGGSAGVGILALAAVGAPLLLPRDFQLCCSAVATAAFAISLLLVGFFFAFVAQCKTPGGFWWRNLFSIRFLLLCLHLLRRLNIWLREKAFPWLGWLLKSVWTWIRKCLHRLYTFTQRIGVYTGKALNRFFSLMPLTWQWVVAGILLFCLLLLAGKTRSILLMLACLAASVALILYGAHCFGILLESTRKMGQGNLNTKVDSKRMLGSFREFAGGLNDLANVAMVAAQKQLKSERMKTELITNVSHDIKTPLTSIINYVDLLQKPHTQEEAEQYLDVLDRQSQRLKKLVEDLMDMSKASTGNMTVEITRLDAVESVNQALGEFSDKLERAQLHPVFRHSEDSVPMMADGKLVWRVLSNLLSNAVKYGMPGTRIYLDLLHVNGKVIISLKNISREELNINAEELMERFVRGDISRNTEGSGLGLNIAKSLMELQKGHLQLLVDGDLFKVTLIFPAAE